MIDVKDKNIFLSGPMTGHDHNNILAFLDAHIALNEMGAKSVFDPAFEWYRDVMAKRMGRDHEHYMRRCVNSLTRFEMFDESGEGHYDMLVQLPDWSDSKGARLEFLVAKACGIEVRSLGEVVGGDD